MFKQHRLGYAKKDGFQIAALPYAGGTYQFVVFLPDTVDGLAKVEKSITGELLSECARLNPSEVRLSFPRIRLDPPVVSLKQTLAAMGAGLMFDIHKADLSRMVREPVFVSRVYHRAYLELDEEGTKAASATAAVIRPKNGVPREVPHEVVKADHPFLFMIQHVPSGACLFLGRLTDPAPEAAAVDGTAPAKVETAPAKK
jgi:serpin B